LTCGGIGCRGRPQHRRQDGVAEGARPRGAHGEGRHVPARPSRLSRCRSTHKCSNLHGHTAATRWAAYVTESNSTVDLMPVCQYVSFSCACHPPVVLTQHSCMRRAAAAVVRPRPGRRGRRAEPAAEPVDVQRPRAAPAPHPRRRHARLPRAPGRSRLRHGMRAAILNVAFPSARDVSASVGAPCLVTARKLHYWANKYGLVSMSSPAHSGSLQGRYKRGQ